MPTGHEFGCPRGKNHKGRFKSCCWEFNVDADVQILSSHSTLTISKRAMAKCNRRGFSIHGASLYNLRKKAMGLFLLMKRLRRYIIQIRKRLELIGPG
jgi:hypothetical protein